MSLPYASAGRAAHHLTRAAVLAPSPHNSQPWFFAEEGRDQGFEIHLDRGRRLILTDPAGREAVIACGAALFNVRIAVRHLGFRPAVTLLPDSRDSGFLAQVGYAAHAPATADEARLARAIPLRHTHRGPFGTEPLPDTLLAELRDHARAEGADLQIIDEPEGLDHLAELVRAAENVHRADHGHTAELARCIGPYGLPVDACRHHPDRTFLPSRDYLGLARRITLPSRRKWRATGTVVVLTTLHDDRTDWLRSGQALQRLLLHAATRQVMAAFHTQPLELPELRTELRTHLAAHRFPQAILRLGHTTEVWNVPRRAPAEVLVRGSVPVGR
ncbi:hypothetical protein AB0I00_21075 [Streptomyces sp. NPDC050803]|uniref:Acg family FMN-binding oxidoreductase n=1 Tax=unclassified Streptomyces TaxID=2593676 RepID=UPI00342AE022